MKRQGGAGRAPGEGENYPFSQVNIERTLKEIRLMVRNEARHIRRAPHLDDEDLVQEVLTHIYANRHQFKAYKSSYKTWALRVARNKLYNIAEKSFRQCRCPTTLDGRRTLEMSWDALEKEQKEPCNPFCCPQPAQALEYTDLVDCVAERLVPTARRVLKALAYPPDDLCKISRQDWISSLRKKKTGQVERVPRNVRLQTSHVAEHLGLTYSVVAKARKKIADEIKVVCADL